MLVLMKVTEVENAIITFMSCFNEHTVQTSTSCRFITINGAQNL